MPTRYTALASCSCTRKCFGSAGKTDNLERRSGPPPDRLRSSRKSPRPECASEPPVEDRQCGGAGQRQAYHVAGAAPTAAGRQRVSVSATRSGSSLRSAVAIRVCQLVKSGKAANRARRCLTAQALASLKSLPAGNVVQKIPH